MISKKADAVNSAPSPDITERKQARVKNEEKDREIWVGESRFYLGEDDILYETVVGEQNERMATEMRKVTNKLQNMVEGKMSVLIDLNKTGTPSSGARKIGQGAFENEKLRKIALFGLHPVARVIASFVIGVTRKRDIRFFKTREEAFAWLKE